MFLTPQIICGRNNLATRDHLSASFPSAPQCKSIAIRLLFSLNVYRFLSFILSQFPKKILFAPNKRRQWRHVLIKQTLRSLSPGLTLSRLPACTISQLSSASAGLVSSLQMVPTLLPLFSYTFSQFALKSALDSGNFVTHSRFQAAGEGATRKAGQQDSDPFVPM